MKKLFSLLALAPLWLSAQVPQIGSSVQFKDTRTSTNTALAWLDTNKPTRTSGAVDPSVTCSAGDLYIQTATRHLWACFGATSTDWLDIGFVGGSASFAGLVGDPTDNTSLGAVLNSKADLSALTSHTGNVSNPHSTTKTQVGLANVTNALQLQASLNLSDLGNLITARSNLGLGGSATLNVGTVTGTVAAGDHLHTSTYAALVHGHAASDITSGLLGIARIAGSGTCDSTTVVYGDQVCRTPPGSSGGEANTVSNQGSSGVGIFKSKLGVDLGFYKLNAASSKVSITLNASDYIDFDVVPGNIAHQTLSGAGTNTHAQIDTHLSATNNPHGTTAAQVSAPALTVMTTLGDLPYRDGSTWVRLAGNTASSKRLLCQTGTGTISAAPSWCALVAGDIPTLNQNTTGSAASLSAVSALPNGTTATTQTQADNSTKVASTAYVDTGLATRASSTHATSHQNGGSDEVATATAAANAIPKAGAGGTLAAGWFPTLNQNTTGTAANLSGTPALPNGTTGTTQSQADNSTKLSTTAYVDTLGATKAPLASPTFTGTPAAPTATAGTSTTQLATTAFVAALGALKQSLSEKDTNGGYVGRDSSGNATITGTLSAASVSTGQSGSAAGYLELGQGTAPSLGTSAITLYAPTVVTSYKLRTPAAGFTGLLFGTNTSNDVVLSAVTGTASDCVHVDGSSAACGAGSLSASGTPLIHQLSAWTNSSTLKGLTVGTDNQVLLGSTGADPAFGALPVAALPGEYYALSTGSSNAYVVAPTSAVTSYVTGEKYFFKSSFANTGPATVDFNGVGAKTVKKVQGAVTTDLAANDIRSGQMVAIIYDGTNMQMVSQLGNASGATTIASTTALLKGDGAGNGSATDLTGDVTTSGAQATTLAAKYKVWSCQAGIGDGLNAITAGTYLQSICYNDTGATVTLSGIKCYTDNAGTSTMAVTNGAGTALLTGAVTCSTSFAAGTQSGTTTIASGDYLKFSFVADGTSKQSTWVITGSR